MMKELSEVLQGREGNYLLPFFWQHGGKSDLAARVEKIQESGCRAFCVESRPYEDFCGPAWWEDMACILSEAKKRDMQIWILDDKHFPTGYANGLIKKKYPQHRRWYLCEHHADVMGPCGASLLIPALPDEAELLCICAFRRTGNGEELEGEAVTLKAEPGARFLHWQAPEGCWRVFFLYKSRIRRGEDDRHDWYIDMLSEESVQVLLEAVYEPHYEHFGEYFGSTIAGFFSDEPSLDAPFTGPWGRDSGFYYRTVGKKGTAMPWKDDILHRMRESGIPNPLSALPGLWYPVKEGASEIRLQYMNAVTNLWKENFSHTVGNWCRSHGVQYIGHVIEDMNAHARLGCSAGHFFRALDGQDMSGIDIVLHQVMPGMAHYQTAASLAEGVVDPEFFHYVLPALGASKARLAPHMKGRAMCEVFGAFGWAEGAPFMKWQMDFLLVRGINHFVPHAFNDRFPDEDSPPHFYADGNDPQFPGFTHLMRYVNRMSHLLTGADRAAPAAILYHAEAEWMNGDTAMMMQKPAKVLYDAHIDYDIVPLDALADAAMEEGAFFLNGHRHSFLVVPRAELLPHSFRDVALRLREKGVPVFFVGQKPAFPQDLPGECIPLEKLAETVLQRELAHSYCMPFPLLRVGHFRRGNADLFMLFNESTVHTVREKIRLPAAGRFLQLDFQSGDHAADKTESGEVSVCLTPYQSTLLVFDDGDACDDFPAAQTPVCMEELHLQWEVSLTESGLAGECGPYRKIEQLYNITGPEGREDFSGLMRYRAEFTVKDTSYLWMDLGMAGQTAELLLIGDSLGIRICRPFRWNIASLLQKGRNSLEVVVANTLVHRLQDPYSQFMPVPPSGLTGPLTLLK